ncbi:MAG: NADH-quinone oxidoreductase subunit A [Acidobacteria bacterium]|nr:MAG: NADH-quinone oxidoreductase subunit A [Acidobacteriota bacterium]PYV40938.1 MAG: NADH-quinone oxidoreductase subunit A [Acidobacteriota bacterium]
MLTGFASVLLFMIVAVMFLVGSLIFASIMRYKGKYSPEKYISYECGEDPTGSAWIQFNIRFYVIALIFIIFDVEIIFLLPWAVVFKQLGMFAFVEGLIFIAILVVGLAYVWAKGDLLWVKAEDLEQPARPRQNLRPAELVTK